MCLAIYKPKGVTIKKKYLRNGWDANEDGAGFAIARGGKVEIQKGFFTFKEFYSAFRQYNHAKEVAIIHFRFATHGVTNVTNCHPFALGSGDQYAMIHNGVIDIECSDKSLSDTAHFAELVLAPMLEAGVAFDSGALRFLVEGNIGDLNKVVILRGDGAHVIYNEKQGEWKNGSWYSNGGYKWSGGDWTRYLPSGYGKGNSSAYAGYSAACTGKVEWKEAKRDFNDYSAYEPRGVEGYGSEWEYKHNHETNTWERTKLSKRLNEMSEEEWRRECEEEMQAALRDDEGREIADLTEEEENEQYAG
jgi:hypothetical protein